MVENNDERKVLGRMRMKMAAERKAISIEGELYLRLKDFSAAHTRINGKLIRRDDYFDLVLNEVRRELHGILKPENPLDWIYHTGRRVEALKQFEKYWFGTSQSQDTGIPHGSCVKVGGCDGEKQLIRQPSLDDKCRHCKKSCDKQVEDPEEYDAEHKAQRPLS